MTGMDVPEDFRRHLAAALREVLGEIVEDGGMGLVNMTEDEWWLSVADDVVAAYRSQVDR